MAVLSSPQAGLRGADHSMISDKPRIGHLLMRLMEARAPLTVTFAGNRSPSTSILLQLDLVGGQMVLDEPFPLPPEEHAQQIHLRGRVDGSVVEFDVSQIGLDLRESEGALRVTVPSRMLHSERRGEYRVPIPTDLQLPPTTFTSEDGAFRGRLLDVSATGAGSTVSLQDCADASMVRACALSLPGTRLIAEIEICSVEDEGGARRVGFRFTHLSNAQQTAMTRAVASLDRQLLRRYTSAAWV